MSFNTWAAIGVVSEHKGSNCGIERNKQKITEMLKQLLVGLKIENLIEANLTS
jgi:hypothetical protein